MNSGGTQLSYQYQVPYLPSYELGDRPMLDYAIETVVKVKYGCKCVFTYLPSGSRVFETAPVAEKSWH